MLCSVIPEMQLFFACRLDARTDAYEWYLASRADTHEEKITEVTKRLRDKYPDFTKPRDIVRSAVNNGQDRHAHRADVHPQAPKPKAGRPTLMSIIGELIILDVIKEIKKGYEVDGEVRAYGTGERLRECVEAAAVMDNHDLTPQALIRVLKQADADIICRSQITVRAFTDATMVLRLAEAQQRQANLTADPNWHNKCFMLDTSHKFMSQLLGLTERVITHKSNNLARSPKVDKRNTWRKVKVVWLTVINPLGGVCQLVFCPGTTDLETEVSTSQTYI